MTRRLHISEDLSLPATAVTETFGILAVRGAGKTNTARVMAEEMFAAGAPFVAVDPIGSWWGLRAGRDGKPGLPIVVFGGKHGDVPLERAAGNLVADLVVDERLSCVLDLSGFDSEAAKKQFLLDFFRRLYARNTEPLHLFLEEADDYLPQKPMREELHLLRAAENIVRRGRAKGLGMTIITQRSAVVAKNVLTQVGTLITLRTTSPQDRAAVEAWVKYHGEKEEILGSLASLKDGEAWVWSPNLLQKTVQVRFRLSTTFDSGATPKLGGSGKAAATLADVDLSALQKRMADTIERAKQEDPKALKAEVARLKRELAAKPAPAQAKTERVEVPVLKDAQIQAFGKLIDRVERLLIDREAPRPKSRPAVNGEASGLSKCQRGVLVVLAQHPEGCDAKRLVLLAGYAWGGGFRNELGGLRTAGLIEGSNTGTMTATPAGVAAAGDFEPLPTGRALVQYWLNHPRFSLCQRKVLAALLEHPEGLGAEALTAVTGYAWGGGFRNELGALRTAGVLVGKNTGVMQLAEELLEASRG